MRPSTLTVSEVISEVTRIARLDSSKYVDRFDQYRVDYNKRRAQRAKALELVRRYVPYPDVTYAPVGQSTNGKFVLGVGRAVLFNAERNPVTEVWPAFADYLINVFEWRD